jgi:hypothetical protein
VTDAHDEVDMKSNQPRLSALIYVAVMAFFMVSTPTQAAGLGGGVSIGGAECSAIERQIKRDWMELKEFFRPDQKDFKRPRSREFFCVSPNYTNNEMPVRQRSFGLSCYNVQGTKFCCDKQRTSCAAL